MVIVWKLLLQISTTDIFNMGTAEIVTFAGW